MHVQASAAYYARPLEIGRGGAGGLQGTEENVRLYKRRRDALDCMLSSIAAWLAAVPVNVKLIEHPPETKLRDVTFDKIEKRRGHIRVLLANLRQIDLAPRPVTVLKLKAREKIEELAERGRPGFDLEDIDASICWPTKYVDVSGSGGQRNPLVTDTEAMFAWLFKDQLIAAIEREFDDAADKAHALSDGDRREQFKTVLSDLLKTEREEEALVSSAMFAVVRRASADPRAVLGLASSLPGPRRNLRYGDLIASMTV